MEGPVFTLSCCVLTNQTTSMSPHVNRTRFDMKQVSTRKGFFTLRIIKLLPHFVNSEELSFSNTVIETDKNDMRTTTYKV